MKTIRQSVRLLIALLFVSACSTAPVRIPEKYNLDNQLENVPHIFKFSLMSWAAVDNQSFILQTSPNNYYLIILDIKSNRLPFSNSIQISNTGYMIWPGYNNVLVNDDGFEDSYIINKIYRFKDYEQVRAIRAQLSGGTK